MDVDVELEEPLADVDAEEDPHHQQMINELDALLEMHKEPVAGDALDGQVNLDNHEGLDEFNKSEVVIDSELGGDDDVQPQDTFNEMDDDANSDED